MRFYPVRFTPTSSKYANEECQGVFIIVTDRAALRPVRLGIEIAAALNSLYGSQYQLETAAHLLGSRDSLAQAARRGEDPAAIASAWGAGRSSAGGCCARSTCCIADRSIVYRARFLFDVHPLVGDLDERQDVREYPAEPRPSRR